MGALDAQHSTLEDAERMVHLLCPKIRDPEVLRDGQIEVLRASRHKNRPIAREHTRAEHTISAQLADVT